MALKEALEIRKSELFRGSLALLILLNLANVINYVFQFSMARILGAADYGVFAVLTSIIYIFSVPSLSIQTVISKYTTRFASKDEFGKIKGFLESMSKKMVWVSLVIFLIFSAISVFLSKSLNISVWLLIITGLYLFVAFTYPILLGILQGMKKFVDWGVNSILCSVIKLVSALLLVIVGLKVYGAVLGFILGTFAAIFLALPSLKKIIKSEKIEEDIKIFSREFISTFFAMLIIVVIYSIDVILARIFFPADVVGNYAVISMIGKIILFGAMGIGSAMFPISSEKFEKGDRTRSVIKKSFLATAACCFLAVLVFALFPDFVIKILFGSQYLSLKALLVYVSIAFSFISFLNILVLYQISVDKFKLKNVLILLASLAVHILILSFFNRTIEIFSMGFMASTIIIFIANAIFIKYGL